MKKLTFLLVISFYLTTLAQLDELQKIALDGVPTNYERSYVFQKADTLIYFYRSPTVAYINVEESYDFGKTWNHKQRIEGFTFPQNDPRSYDIVQFSENIFCIASLTYYGNLEVYRYSLTDNQLELIGNLLEVGSSVKKVELTLIDESKFIVSFCDEEDNIFSYSTNDAALTWSSKNHFSVIDKNELPLEITYHNNYLYAVFADGNSIEAIIGENLGASWSASTTIFTNENSITNPEIHSDGSNLYLVFEESFYDPVAGEMQTDICYLVSSDNGLTWSDKQYYTTFIEKDYFSEVNLSMGDLFITTRSNRPDVEDLYTYVGILPETIDPAPPVLYWREQPNRVDYEVDFQVRAFINDETGFSSVAAVINDNIYTMYDDGNHNDSLAGDYIFGATIDGVPKNVSQNPGDVYDIEINNFYLPVRNNGVLADIYISSSANLNLEVEDLDANKRIFTDGIAFGEWGTQGKYEGKPVLFSAGFYFSGYTNGQLWANAVSTAGLIEDYQAGLVGSNPHDSKNLIYPVYEGDPHFGKSWQNWKDAVDNGAYFYDGDGDGIYNPVDKNSNGVWDTNEDKPDLLYDAVLYTVYNDGVPSSERRFSEIEPQGIEIRQSIYASNRNTILDDVIFIRYSLIYKGLGNASEPDSLENVIFSAWNDADIGDATNDLTGCDTTLQAGYSYDDGDDPIWESEAPAIFKAILQGPRVKADDPNSVAYNKLGPDLGIETYDGYKNLGMTTFAPPHKNVMLLMEPGDPVEMRRYQEALYPNDGAEVDPCDFKYGEVFGGVNCADVNNKYWYSGDPVTQYGWIQTVTLDMRDLTNTGPFTLKKDEPMDIIVAYVIGKGTDALNSITRAREITQYVHEEYERNFSTIVGVEDKSEKVVNKYSLSQNYPNPFNPTTSIEYQVSSSEKVSLKVYDILGREIKTLVNEVKSPGSYEVQLNASQLASGVYFYRLTAGNFVQTKKMILLR